VVQPFLLTTWTVLVECLEEKFHSAPCHIFASAEEWALAEEIHTLA
jgi:hypothetical protein